MNTLLLQKFNKIMQSPREIQTVGFGKVRPSAPIFDALKRVAIISVIAFSMPAGIAHAGKIDDRAFNDAYNQTLDHEGGYRITVDMPIKQGKKVVGYKRIFNSATKETEIVHLNNKTVLRNIVTNKSVSLHSADVSAKIPVVTHAGINSKIYGIDVLHMTSNKIKDLYRENYWPSDLLRVGENVAKIAFDIGVNQGVSTRNQMLAKVVFDLANYEINPDTGISTADIAVVAGIAKRHPGAIEYGLSMAAKDRYENLAEHSRHKQNKEGWLERAESYAEIAGEQGRVHYEQLLSNANMGREALLAQAENDEQLNEQSVLHLKNRQNELDIHELSDDSVEINDNIGAAYYERLLSNANMGWEALLAQSENDERSAQCKSNGHRYIVIDIDRQAELFGSDHSEHRM